MHGKLLTVVGAVLGSMLVISLSGCGKAKQPQQGKGTAPASQLAKEPAAADTGDIFKEFYSEDSSAKKGKAGAKKAGKQAEEKPTASSFLGEFSENGRYTVQVSCVKSQSFANSMAAKLKDKGFPAYVAEVQNPTPSLSGTFYRVRIAGFKVVADAKSFGQNTLAADGYEFWVDKKSNDNVGMEGYGLGSGGGSAAGSYQRAPAPAATPASSPSSSTESSFSTTPSSTPSSGTESSGSSSFSGSSSSQSSSSFSTTPSSGSSSSASGTTTGSSSFSSEPSTGNSSGSSTTSGSTGASGSASTSSSPSTGSSTGTSGTQGTGTTGSGKDSSSGGW
ncbi:MAG TPA: SPOR domain-containing protein [Chitinivibrionales bacterium]|jgi:hypothetical protein|nr:SPOR domain-containing protein [Chitinivibrionales bacterium]